MWNYYINYEKFKIASNKKQIEICIYAFLCMYVHAHIKMNVSTFLTIASDYKTFLSKAPLFFFLLAFFLLDLFSSFWFTLCILILNIINYEWLIYNIWSKAIESYIYLWKSLREFFSWHKGNKVKQWKKKNNSENTKHNNCFIVT